MSECKADNIRHINNGFESEGPMSPASGIVIHDQVNQGLHIWSSKKNRGVSIKNVRGSGLTILTENEHGLGDGMEPHPGARKTQDYAAGNGDISKPTLTMLCNADGTGFRMTSGGGTTPVMTLSTADGQNGLMITDGYVALYSHGVELVVDSKKRGLVFATKFRIQESIEGAGQVTVKNA